MSELNKFPIYEKTSFEFFNKPFFPIGDIYPVIDGDMIVEKYTDGLPANFDKVLKWKGHKSEFIRNHYRNVSDVFEVSLKESFGSTQKLFFEINSDTHTHLVINALENTTNTLNIQIDQSSYGTVFIEVIIEKNAKLDIHVQNIGIGQQFAVVHSNIGDQGRCNVSLNDFASSNVFEICSNLIGDSSHSEIDFVGFAYNITKSITSKLVHIGKKTFGRINQRGVTFGNSIFTLNGYGIIKKNSKKSDNYQHTKVLKLDDLSIVNANPFLFIDEFDVFASHSATISNIDEQQVYYLMSRGIKKTEARKLIVKNFLMSAMKDLEDSEKEFVEDRLHIFHG